MATLGTGNYSVNTPTKFSFLFAGAGPECRYGCSRALIAWRRSPSAEKLRLLASLAADRVQLDR
jgi:hypothetical protein